MRRYLNYLPIVLLLCAPLTAAPATAEQTWWHTQTLSTAHLRGGSTTNIIVEDDGWLRLEPGAAQGTIETAPISVALPFDAVSLRWREQHESTAALDLRLRTSADGIVWSTWHDIHADPHATSPDGWQHGELLLLGIKTGLQRYVQVSATLVGMRLGDLTLFVSDGSRGPTTAQALQRIAPSSDPVPIVSRSAWGNPEGQASPNWPPEFAPVTHIILHHTATTNSATDWAAVVRSIWAYHAQSLGWGDIGYHYLIDPNGVIYEGRAGGDQAEAGHTLGYNRGTIGIAWLGCFDSSGCGSVGGGIAPSEASLLAAEALIAAKALEHGLRLDAAATDARGRAFATLSGHQDLLATACPGDLLKGQIGRFLGLSPQRFYAPIALTG